MTVKKLISLICCLTVLSGAELSAAQVATTPATKKKTVVKTTPKTASKTAAQPTASKPLTPAVSPSAPTASKVTITNDFSITANSITGDGKANSSLSDGIHMLNILGINGYGTTDSGYQFNYNIGLKGTDDKRNDIKNLSLTNLNYKLSNAVDTWNFGDIYENYSQYSLNSALKGVSWRRALVPADAPLSRSLGLLAGVAYPRWDCIYGGMETKVIPRQALGANYRHQYQPNLTVGYTGVYANDLERVNPTDTLFTGNVFAADAQYQPFGGLDINSEFAFSSLSSSIGGGGSTSDTGTAFRIEGVGTGGPSRASLEYERVSTKFASLLGSATPDREKVKGKWRYKYDQDISMNYGMLWYRNKLDGSGGGFTALRPEAGVSKRNLFSRATATGDLTYRLFTQTGAGIDTIDHTLNANYRDTFGDIANDTNLGYSLYKTDANVRKTKEMSLNTSFSKSLPWDTLTLRPTLSLGIWNANDELVSVSNKITEYSIGTAIEAPARNIVSHLKIGQNKLDSDAANTGSNKTFFSGDIFFRPSVKQFAACVLYARMMYNNYTYSAANSDFRESSLTAGMNVQF